MDRTALRRYREAKPGAVAEHPFGPDALVMNTVTLDGTVSGSDVRDWIDDSYDLVVERLPRRVRDGLETGSG